MTYRRVIPIEFNHCDPAGIVFYPRYFEMINSVVENFFADVLEYPFARICLEERCGVPTVHLDADFRAPSRLGERVAFTLDVDQVGRASASFVIQGAAGDEIRLDARVTLVWVGRSGRSEPWPPSIRDGLLMVKETVR